MNQRLTFMEQLTEQRWDDHRYYHQSYINQALHLFSASCFLVTYVLIPIEPMAAVFFGWFIAMWSRQIGHFFFEPKGHDDVNGCSFEHKERIKVGFNKQRKIAMLIAWLSAPAVLYFVPAALDAMISLTGRTEFEHNLAMLWVGLAVTGLVGRTLWLMVFRDVQTGLVWFTKILTDPFHDIKQYHAAPIHLLRGERLDPMHAPASR